MAEYTIGDVERITGVKAHALRYWEDAVPFLRPRRDDEGRRVYGERDLELIERLKYLVHEKKYTLEGAGERLVAELTDARHASAREAVGQVRAELMGLYAIVKKRKEEEDGREERRDGE
jgi:DNA-binding transcriptional MerR regulator